jgi:PAS domain S-box-containing protein
MSVLGILVGIQLAASARERRYLEGIRGLFDTAGDAGVLLTPDRQRILEVNQKAEVLFGLPRQELIGSLLSSRSLDAEGDREQLRLVVQDGAVRTYDQRFVNGAGARRLVETTACLTKFRDRSLVFCVMRDVTDRRLGEHALQAAHEELGTFVQIASHDLRTPLVNLNAFIAEWRLQSGEDNEEEALQYLEASAVNLERLSNAFIRLSRYHHHPLDRQNIDAEAVVQELLASMSDAPRAAQAAVLVKSLPRVWADRWALGTIFQELLSNAVAYLRPGEKGWVRVEGETAAHEVIFRIRDNGRGIAEEDHEKVFQPFRRCGRQDVPGEGMGLVFARTLIRRHGGRIWFTSIPGEGSTFGFSIAVRSEGTSSAETPARPARGTAPVSPASPPPVSAPEGWEPDHRTVPDSVPGN